MGVLLGVFEDPTMKATLDRTGGRMHPAGRVALLSSGDPALSLYGPSHRAGEGCLHSVYLVGF